MMFSSKVTWLFSLVVVVVVVVVAVVASDNGKRTDSLIFNWTGQNFEAILNRSKIEFQTFIAAPF